MDIKRLNFNVVYSIEGGIMELNLERLRKSWEKLVVEGVVDNRLGKAVMYLTDIRIANIKNGVPKNKDMQIKMYDDFKGDAYLEVLSRLQDNRLNIDLDKADKQLLMYLKNMVSYAILTVSQRILRENVKNEEFEVVELSDVVIDRLYFEPLFSDLLDTKINGFYPIWIGAYGEYTTEYGR